jgi:hypothetical protein
MLFAPLASPRWLPDGLLDGKIFYSLKEALIAIESWRRHFNILKPHGSLGYKPPAPEVFVPGLSARAVLVDVAEPPALASGPLLINVPTAPLGECGSVGSETFIDRASPSRAASATRRDQHLPLIEWGTLILNWHLTSISDSRGKPISLIQTFVSKERLQLIC